jgi:hypothetical protein
MKLIVGLVLFAFPFFAPEPSFAHAFGATYTLPLPSWIFLYGGGVTVALSFLLVSFFVGQKNGSEKIRRININTNPIVRGLTSRTLIKIGKALGLLLWVGIILAGYWGSQDTVSNISPTIFWVVFLLGFTYLTAIFGDLWAVINPLRIIVYWLERLLGPRVFGRIRYPRKLSYAPALIFYYLLIYNELLSGGEAAIPANLSGLILTYSLATVVGAVIFGTEDWFRYGEFFSVFFRLVGKISPIIYENKKIYLTNPCSMLLESVADSSWLVLFIVFMLASTAFDGFRGTTIWFQWDLAAYDYYSNFGQIGYQMFHAVALVAAPLVFLAAYLFAIVGMKKLVGNKDSVLSLAKKFAFSLVPIAVVYNVAHYYTLLLTQGQSLVSLISDPLGKGWDLFGSVGFTPNVGIIRADVIWYSQVFFIVLGHVVAVVLAHTIALRIEKTPRKAIVGQLPLLILMVAYTLTGLWILSQPYSFRG